VDEEESQREKRYKPSVLLITIFLGILLSLIVLELLLRGHFYLSQNNLLGLSPTSTTIKWEEDELVGKMLTPNQSGWFVTRTGEYYTWIDVNSQGWRDVEHNFEKPENTYRIAIIGDSFVENFQVPLEDTFFRKLENKLNGMETGTDYEVLAFGQGNTGTTQQYLLLKEYVGLYDPDLIIHMFYTGNDVRNNHKEMNKNPLIPYFSLNENGKLVPIKAEMKSTRPLYSIRETFKKIKVVERILQLRHSYLNSKSVQPGDYHSDLHVYDNVYSEDYEEAWDITKKLLLESKRAANDIGAEYKLVTIAANEQVDDWAWNQYKSIYPAFEEANIDRERPNKVIDIFCIQNELDCYHTLPYYRDYVSRNPGAKTHYALDGHWNSVGSNLAADYLFDILEGYFDSTE